MYSKSHLARRVHVVPPLRMLFTLKSVVQKATLSITLRTIEASASASEHDSEDETRMMSSQR